MQENEEETQAMPRRFTDYIGILLWLVSTIFIGGIFYGEVKENSKASAQIPLIVEDISKIKNEQNMIRKEFDYQAEYQKNLLDAIKNLVMLLNVSNNWMLPK